MIDDSATVRSVSHRSTGNRAGGHSFASAAGSSGLCRFTVRDEHLPAVRRERVLLRGYFTEGRAISDRTALADLAVEAGIARANVDAVLASDSYASEVRADEVTARELGIRGMPFFVRTPRGQTAETYIGSHG